MKETLSVEELVEEWLPELNLAFSDGNTTQINAVLYAAIKNAYEEGQWSVNCNGPPAAFIDALKRKKYH